MRSRVVSNDKWNGLLSWDVCVDTGDEWVDERFPFAGYLRTCSIEEFASLYEVP